MDCGGHGLDTFEYDLGLNNQVKLVRYKLHEAAIFKYTDYSFPMFNVNVLKGLVAFQSSIIIQIVQIDKATIMVNM